MKSAQSVLDHPQRRNVEIKAGAVGTELYSLGESHLFKPHIVKIRSLITLIARQS